MKDKPCFKCNGTGKMIHPYGPGGKEVKGMGCRYCGGTGKATYKPEKKEGYGALDMSKDKKQAFKGAHWTVKFDENKKKQGPTMKMNELKEMVHELVREMWADTGMHPGEIDTDKQIGDDEEGGVKPNGRLTSPGSDKFVDLYKGDKQGPISSLPSVGGAMSEAYPGETWKPKTYIKTPQEVASLIFGLDEGEGITFMSNKQGRDTEWIAIEKTVEGDEYVYKYFQYKDLGNKHYLETDEDIMKLTTKIAQDPKLTLYEHHEVSMPDGSAYRKSTGHYDHEDQSPGDYEMNGPDQPSWRELYEAKGLTAKEKLKNLIKETIEEIEKDDEPEEVRIAKSILDMSKYAGTEKNQQAWNLVKGLARELINLHKKKASLPKQQSLKRSLQYKHGKSVDGMEEVAPSGWEGTVKAMKKHGKEIDNPWALTNWMKSKGYKSHKND